MSAEPVSLPIALVFAAIGGLLILWFFGRVALERRQLAHSRQTILSRIPPELHGKLDRFLQEVHLVRERADSWARDDWYASRECLDALDMYRDRVLAEPTPEMLDSGIASLTEIRAEFEREPGVAMLAAMARRLKAL